MLHFRNYWTFPVPGGSELVVASSDREGLLLLNTTAAWIWQHREDKNLTAAFADHFGITLAHAEADIRETFRSWELLSKSNPALPSLEISLPASFRFGHDLFQVAEIVFRLNFDSEPFLNEVNPRLAPVRVENANEASLEPDHTFSLVATGENGYAVFRNGELLVTAPIVTACRAVLLQEMTRLAVPDRNFKLILHAGAVGNAHSCVILAGASYSGKSTLCAATMQSGLFCYSDDSACLTQDFNIAGMPFAISLREGSWPLFPELDRPRFIDSNLNGTSPEAKPVGLIFVNYDPQAETTTVEPVTTFDALARLNASGFWVEHSQEAITAFLHWLGCIPIHELRYSDLQQAVTTVRQAVP